MIPSTHDLVSALHGSSTRWVLAITGGGASVAGELLGVPGGSRTLLEIVVPYHEQALWEFLALQPENACSAKTSQAMARRALERARWLTGGNVYGLGATASLVSDRPKRGDHRVHVSTAGFEVVKTWSLTLNKGARDRAEEERVVSSLVLHAMARTLGLGVPAAAPLLPGEEILESAEPLSAWPVRLDEAGAVLVAADGQIQPEAAWEPQRSALLLPGAFNPLHTGHLRLAAVAEKLAGKPAAFELSVVNVDKPELTREEFRVRLAQFVERGPVWLTRAARFIDKAGLFPGATFVVGADTAERLVAPRYYADDEKQMRGALEFFRRQGCRFLVAGRAGAAPGSCLTLNDIAVPEEYRDLFAAIPEEHFRVDVSSTKLRQSRGIV
jgi:hypothetical protein